MGRSVISKEIKRQKNKFVMIKLHSCQICAKFPCSTRQALLCNISLKAPIRSTEKDYSRILKKKRRRKKAHARSYDHPLDMSFDLVCGPYRSVLVLQVCL